MYQPSSAIVLGNYDNSDSLVIQSRPKLNKSASGTMEWCHQCKQRSNNVVHCGQGCNKKFCSRCLLRHYGEQEKDINLETWLCPFCKKICCCAYCRRNKDKLLSNSGSNTTGNTNYANNKNSYSRKTSTYPSRQHESLKRDRDDDYMNDEYDDDFDASDDDEIHHPAKRHLGGYPVSNPIMTRNQNLNNNLTHNNHNTTTHNTNTHSNNNVHLYANQQLSNLERTSSSNNANTNVTGSASYFNTIDPILDTKTPTASSAISVPVALRVIPVQENTLKIPHPTEESYEWNPGHHKEEWMGNLFSHDLDRNDYSALVEYPGHKNTGFSPRDNAAHHPTTNNQYKQTTPTNGTQPLQPQQNQPQQNQQSQQNHQPQSQHHPQLSYYQASSNVPMKPVLYKTNPYFVNEKDKEKEKKNRNTKKSVDYDSDYEYPEDEDQKESKYYIAEQKLSAAEMKQTKSNSHTINNYNYQYNYATHEAYQQHENDYPQRQMDVKRSRLPAHAVSVLKEWFYKHSHSPYPTEEEKEKFTKELSLTILQVNNWFTNARRRLLPDRL